MNNLTKKQAEIALQHECPTCGAPPGVSCIKMPNGGRRKAKVDPYADMIPKATPHEDRYHQTLESA